MSEEELLRYRSNLLGADLAVTNFGGGNTSAKLRTRDPLSGDEVTVLWVKGSGGDLGSIGLDGFATLYEGKLLSLLSRYRGRAHEDEMVGLLPLCAFHSNVPAASIDTPLHALLPFAHIDHVHPDALIAIATAKDGEATTREIFGDSVGWMPWQRPGFDLAIKLCELTKAQPNLRACILAGHGVISWGDTSKACYANTIELIDRAARHLNAKLADRPAFGGQTRKSSAQSERRREAARLMPLLRAEASKQDSKIGHFDDSPEMLEFANSRRVKRLCEIGTSCPDHFLRTKMWPLLLDPERVEREGQAYLAIAFDEFRARYSAYYQRCKSPDSPPLRDSNPVVVMLPGVGQFTLAKNKTTARVAGEFFRNAINVMRGAESIGGYVGLPEKEAFGIEYWQLEDAKLRRLPPPRSLEGRIALVTGGAGGIGTATARRLLEEGACVVITDIESDRLTDVGVTLSRAYSKDNIRSTVADVTNESSIQAAFDFAAREYGGVDILVANAGIASSASLEETTQMQWRKIYAVLTEGYFLAARAAFPLMKRQGGGSIVFIGSKNALAAGIDASAYSSAKAASLHLARSLALEGAPFGIRVNTVNPDAVIQGSHIWTGTWREERAKSYGVDAGVELEAFYRQRSLLKRDVLPQDVAEAVLFFASERSSKSTGNILNVDAGNAQAFPR